MSTMLIGYDVEVRDGSDVTQRFLAKAAELHARLGAPATLFLVGVTAENNVAAIRQARDEAPFELGSHTYSHMKLKTICQVKADGVVEVKRGGTLGQLVEEVDRANTVLEREFGVKCRAFRGPRGYYRGLSDRPDLLHLLHAAGIRVLSTWFRNAQGSNPLAYDVQPFFYEPQGFPDMLEVPGTGRLDCNWSVHFGWEPKQYTSPQEFLDYLKDQLDYLHERDWLYNAAQHDDTTIKYDPDMIIMRGLIEHARSIGMAVMNFTEYYDSIQASKS